MSLPPLTPKQMRAGLAERPSLRKRIARGWIVVGSLAAAFAGAMAVAHYVYGEPIHDRATGDLASPASTLLTLALIGGGGALFAVLGALLHRWKVD